jgi:hypothetical protein
MLGLSSLCSDNHVSFRFCRRLSLDEVRLLVLSNCAITCTA